MQIPSMVYPPSSTVSRITRITLLSNLNDWLITDDIFRHLMYNFFLKYTEKLRSGVLFVSKVFSQSTEAWISL